MLIPLSDVQVEFESYHRDLGAAAAEVLHCPRCSRLVTDAHGVCGYCRENAYQCRSCRNINYERRDPFQAGSSPVGAG